MSKNDFKIFNALVLCIILLGLASAVKNVKLVPPTFREEEAVVPAPIVVSTTTPQFVLISFDGSKSIDTWRDIASFKDEMKASNKKLNVTHFINAAYFLTDETKHLYKGPGQEAGKSNIGFSEDLPHIALRIAEVNKAIADGDEVSPHSVGHFSGAAWTKDEWKEEFASFDRIMFGLDVMYPDAHLPKLNLTSHDIIGFRAPFLDRSQGLYDTLHELHFRYDSSEPGTGNEWPKKDAQGMWHIPLGSLELGEHKTPIIAMDYNLYAHDSQAKDTIKKGTPEWDKVYKDTLAAFLAYFNKNYHGNHAPVLMGYHFSQQWNDGVYWEVMKTFARQVCGRPDVRCGTFRDLVDWLDVHGVPNK